MGLLGRSRCYCRRFVLDRRFGAFSRSRRLRGLGEMVGEGTRPLGQCGCVGEYAEIRLYGYPRPCCVRERELLFNWS